MGQTGTLFESFLKIVLTASARNFVRGGAENNVNLRSRSGKVRVKVRWKKVWWVSEVSELDLSQVKSNVITWSYFRSPQMWVRRPRAQAGWSAYSAACSAAGPALPSSSAATPTKMQPTPVLPAGNTWADTKLSYETSGKQEDQTIFGSLKDFWLRQEPSKC